MRKIAVHEKSVVLVLNRAEAKTLARILKTGYVYRSIGLQIIGAKLQAAREAVGDGLPAPESSER